MSENEIGDPICEECLARPWCSRVGDPEMYCCMIEFEKNKTEDDKLFEDIFAKRTWHLKNPALIKQVAREVSIQVYGVDKYNE
jgi:hypothetical protein